MARHAVPATGTRERILDAAERLFLDKGYRGASLRALSSSAAVNLAAVGYHFGSKEELLRAVLERRVAPVNEERLRKLAAVEAGWRRGEPKAPEPVLAALLEPAFQAVAGGATPRDIASLLYSEPPEQMRAHVESLFGDCSRRFCSALARALGCRSTPVLELHFQIVVGGMVHFLAGRHELAPSAGFEREMPERELVGALIGFFAAGLRAAAGSQPKRSRVRERPQRALEVAR